MDASILNEIINLSEVQFSFDTANGEMYQYINNINNVVLWDALLYRILKKLKTLNITVTQSTIEQCKQQYENLKMRIKSKTNTIQLPHIMFELVRLYELHKTPKYPSTFYDIAVVGVALWAFVRVSKAIFERRQTIDPNNTIDRKKPMPVT